METKTRTETTAEFIWRTIVRLVIAAAAVYILYRVRSIIVTVLFAAVLTYAVLPVIDFLCARQISWISRRVQRLAVTTLIFGILGVLLISVVLAVVAPLQAEFVGVQKSFETSLQSLTEMATDAQEWYNQLSPDLRDFIQPKKMLDGVSGYVAAWTKGLVAQTQNAGQFLLHLILIPVLAFYFALDSKTLKRAFVPLLPKRRTREALALIHEVNSIMRTYVIGQIILCVIAGVVTGLIVYFAGMKYVLLIAVIAGIARAVPVVGPIVTGILIFLLAVAQSPILGVNILILFSALHFIESKFIMPKLIGTRMQLHPALIIIVLLVGAEFFGPLVGMFLAVPVAGIMRVLVRYYLIRRKHMKMWGLRGRPDEAEPSPAPAQVELGKDLNETA